jgi:meso-butanediol dehydrogenase / (S,S)-butanediol dehydrogenase / diacetyl reductase
VDYGRQGIRSNVVCPGSVRTEMSDTNMDRIAESHNLDREGAYRLSVLDQPLGRAAMPQEIAPLCAYLASDESSFMTGAVLVIDGGITKLDAGMIAMMR